MKISIRFRHKRPTPRSAGFTIIELMIASVVFSMVLILITYGVIKFNQAFYGGVVQSSTQNATRAVIDNISQAIQFNGGQISTNINGTGWSSICIGNQMYQFKLGQQLNTSGGTLAADQTTQALLVTNNVNNCGGQTPGTVGGPGGTAGGTELLGEHMRLANLSLTQVGTTSLWTLNVRIVYGDADLLCAQSVGGSCAQASTAGATAPDADCKSGTGTPQFCAVSDLTTTVEQRVSD